MRVTADGHGEALEMTDQSNSRTTGKGILTEIKGVNSPDSDSLEDQDGNLQTTKSSHDDAVGMRRMGKDQQLVRHFRLLSISSFVALATAAWEIGLFVLTPGLVDGGRSGLIYNVLWNFIGFGPIYLSMAEMASM